MNVVKPFTIITYKFYYFFSNFVSSKKGKYVVGVPSPIQPIVILRYSHIRKHLIASIMFQQQA